MKILIINGPNLNALHLRDKSQYGTLSLKEIEEKIASSFPEIEFEFFQSSGEGEIIDKIIVSTGKADALIINPAAYSHTSFAIRDALEIFRGPKIEVHLSNIFGREDFRHTSVTAAACTGMICGLKEFSYIAAVYSVKKLIGNE